MQSRKVVEIVSAIVDPNEKKIHLRAMSEDGKIEGYETPAEIWGRVPPGKDVVVELEKIARIFNGQRQLPDGSWEQIPDFKYKKIYIETEENTGDRK